MEVYKNLPEGTLAELIDNVIYMSPSPVANHQKVLQNIFRKLSEQVEDPGNGEVMIAPFDVYLDETSNAVQPDIIVVLRTNPYKVNPKGHFHGVPDLVIEILSPGNKEYDLVQKKTLYERFGVSEYWIVDPESKSCLAYSLKDGLYVNSLNTTGRITSSLIKAEFLF